MVTGIDVNGMAAITQRCFRCIRTGISLAGWSLCDACRYGAAIVNLDGDRIRIYSGIIVCDTKLDGRFIVRDMRP